jgi:hypothetical protein
VIEAQEQGLADPGRGRELERGLGQVISIVVAVDRRLAVASPAVELGQRQGEPAEQVIVGGGGMLMSSPSKTREDRPIARVGFSNQPT